MAHARCAGKGPIRRRGRWCLVFAALTVYVDVRFSNVGVVWMRQPAGAPSADREKAPSAVRAAWLCLVLSSALATCKAQTDAEAPAPAERTGLVAQPCPELELGDSAVDQANVRVFVEVADVNARELPRPIGRWLRENAVTIRSAVNLVGFPNVATSMPWGQCVDAVCASSARSVTITAHPPERSSEPIQLELRIEEAPHEGSENAPKLLLDARVQAAHQEPVLVDSTSAVSDGSIVMTAYLLQRHDDLQRVMTCRARQSEQEKQLGQ